MTDENKNKVPTEGDLERGIQHPEVSNVELYRDLEKRKKFIESGEDGLLKEVMKEALGDWAIRINKRIRKK